MTVNGPECKQWTTCPAGHFIEVAGSASLDQKCRVCPSGKYTAVENSSVCVDKGACAPGTEQTVAGTATTPPTCVPCPVGNYCAGASSSRQPCLSSAWDHDQNAGSDCVAWSNCVGGQVVSNEGSPTTDRKCENCTVGSFRAGPNAKQCMAFVTCNAGKYIKEIGTTTTNQVCSDCPNGQFTSQPNSQTCIDWRTCAAGKYVSNAPSPEQDRVCSDCPPNTYSSQSNQSSCSTPTPCQAGTEQIAPATSTSPATCLPCEAGGYCAGGSATRQDCGGDNWDHDSKSSTPCVPKSVCLPGSSATCGAALGLKGTCASGTSMCDGGGKWGPCSIVPASFDGCLPGNDDSCDGTHTDCICGGFPMPNPASLGLPNPASYDTTAADFVTDRVTGLDWQKQPSAAKYTQDQAIAYCETLVLAGAAGWRLPTRMELVSIVDVTAGNPAINKNAFPSTPPDDFWSSSKPTAPSLFGNGWMVSAMDGSRFLAAGSTYLEAASKALRARCMRTRRPTCYPKRFQVQADGWVYDAATKLTWMRNQAVQMPANENSSLSNEWCTKTFGSGARLPHPEIR